jgi:hypothetical protein
MEVEWDRMDGVDGWDDVYAMQCKIDGGSNARI